MPEWRPIDLVPALREFTIGENDYGSVSRVDHLRLLELVYLIRDFENALLDLKDMELVHGPVHTSVGQEAVAAGCGLALRAGDLVGSTHRAHHHFIGKVLPYHYPEGYDPSAHGFSAGMEDCVERTLSEIMGLKRGWCGGRGGSMHLRHPEAGVIGTNAIVGGGIALTTGAGWALRVRGTGNVAVAFLGDGALNQGILLESANLAKLWNAPVTYFVENNLYAVGTCTGESSSTEVLAQRGVAFGMDGLVVDGMDPVAVCLLMRGVREEQERGAGPRFVEARTYRFYHHAGRIAGSRLGYRSEREEECWASRDPHSRYPAALKKLGLLLEGEDRALKEKVRRVVAEARAKVTSEAEGGGGAPGGLFVPSELWPDPESVSKGVPDTRPQAGSCRYAEREDFSDFTSLTFVNVMSQVAARCMERDPAVIVMGEEVANLGGGAYNATRFPLKAYPERVLNTPISEAGFTGLAFGASLAGLKPIVEIMFPDFALVAADQLFNQIAKLKYLYGGDVEVPLVVRTRIASGLGYGAQHSSDPSGLFAMFRGWRIVAPSNPFDYIGLFNSAVASPDPVLVMEHHSLYKVKGEVPAGDMDYCIPFGRARVFRKGGDVTVATYLRGVAILEEAVDRLQAEGVEVEGIDLRSLDYHSIDYAALGESLKRTGRLVVLEEAPLSMGIGARVACEAQARFWGLLKGPVRTVNSLDVPLPVSKRLEGEALLDGAKAASRIASIVRGEGPQVNHT